MIQINNPLTKNKRRIQIGDVVLFKRALTEDREFFQITNKNWNILYTGFPEIKSTDERGQSLLQNQIGDEISFLHRTYTIENFFSAKDTLYRLTAHDKAKENPDCAVWGDYVLSLQPQGLEVIRWGLMREADLNVLGIHCYHNVDGTNDLPDQFEIGQTYEYGPTKRPITVLNAISSQTFQERFEIMPPRQKIILPSK